MPQWHFTTVDNSAHPSPTPGSYLRSINDDGHMLGGNFVGGGGGDRAFVGTPGSFTELSTPSVPGGGTKPGQIANDGTAVLTGGLHGPNVQPFTYDGSYHSVPVPGGLGTGINDHGTIVGSIGSQGFLDKNGHVSTFSYPGATSTTPEAINDGGRIVGYYTASDDSHHGFYGHQGNLHELDVRGAVSTELLGVNTFGDMVGRFTDHAGKTHGFLDHGGKFTTLDAPGATSTTAYGINDSSEIVGGYFKGGIEHGFTASTGHWST